jgi:hypothetical protein
MARDGSFHWELEKSKDRAMFRFYARMAPMPKLGSRTSSDSMLTDLATYIGLPIFLLSFFLPAVGSLTGFGCAVWALTSWNHDDKISSLALFGGWLNPMVLMLFFLSVFRVAPRFRAVLTVYSLFNSHDVDLHPPHEHCRNEHGFELWPLCLDRRNSLYRFAKRALRILLLTNSMAGRRGRVDHCLPLRSAPHHPHYASRKRHGRFLLRRRLDSKRTYCLWKN